VCLFKRFLFPAGVSVVLVRAFLSRVTRIPVIVGGVSDVQCGAPDGPQWWRRYSGLRIRLQGLQQRLQRLLEFVLVWRLELWWVLVLLFLLLLQLLPQEPGPRLQGWKAQPDEGLPRRRPRRLP